MKIAVISDMHSNIYALDKVIDDIKSKNVDMVVCTGDLVGYGTRPNEVIHKMKEEKILTIMGNYDESPEYYEECLEMVKELRVEDVIFTGQVDVRKHLPDVDLLLLSSISEGQPLAVLEGLATGIPFVCTNVGDCKNLLEGEGEDKFGRAGYIVPVMDSKAMAEAILKCMDHPKVLKEMGQNGKKRVQEFYRREQFLSRYEKMYQEVGGK